MPVDSDSIWYGYEHHCAPGQLILRKRWPPLYQALTLLPFVLASPIIIIAGLYVSYATARAAQAPVWARIALPVVFGVGVLVASLVLWRLLVILVPVTKSVCLCEGAVQCRTLLWRLIVHRALLVSPVQLEVVSHELRNDWGFWLRLRGADGETFTLTIPTVVGETRDRAREVGTKCAVRLAAALEAPVACV